MVPLPDRSPSLKKKPLSNKPHPKIRPFTKMVSLSDCSPSLVSPLSLINPSLKWILLLRWYPCLKIPPFSNKPPSLVSLCWHPLPSEALVLNKPSSVIRRTFWLFASSNLSIDSNFSWRVSIVPLCSCVVSYNCKIPWLNRIKFVSWTSVPLNAKLWYHNNLSLQSLIFLNFYLKFLIFYKIVLSLCHTINPRLKCIKEIG